MLRKTVGCFSRLIKLAILLVVLLVGYAFVEPHLLRVREDTLYFSDLPEAFDGIRVAFLSDLHLDVTRGTEALEKLVRKVHALSPDIILLGGDYAETSEEAVQFFASQPGFSAPLGVFAIPGNHDRTVPESNRDRIIDGTRNAGILPLFNAIYPVAREGQHIYIAGLDDYKTGHPNIDGVAGSLYQEDFVLLLSHDPDSIPRILSSTDALQQRGWADLILCGHTHGGQVNIGSYSPFLQRVVRNTQYRYGLFREEGSTILVTSGTGTSMVPMRLGAPPEIRLLTLRRGQPS